MSLISGPVIKYNINNKRASFQLAKIFPLMGSIEILNSKAEILEQLKYTTSDKICRVRWMGTNIYRRMEEENWNFISVV